MEKLLQKRKELLDRYYDLEEREINLNLAVSKKKRNDDIFYEIEKVQFEHAKNKVVASLLETMLPLAKENKTLAHNEYERIGTIVKSKGLDENSQMDLYDAQTKFSDMAMVVDTLEKVIRRNCDDLYEIDLEMRELDNIANIGSEQMIREALTNVRILKNLSNVCSLSEEQEIFGLILGTNNRLKNNLEPDSDSSNDK